MAAYSDQDHNTTAVYVDGMLSTQFNGNSFSEEKEVIARFKSTGATFTERIVFGYGRVALVFRTRK